jgi:predicted RNA methylase
VVDLGSGTGLSTGIWAAHAERVVGIEPLDEMRQVAEATTTAPNETVEKVQFSYFLRKAPFENQ